MWRRVFSVMAVVCLAGATLPAFGQTGNPYRQKREVTFEKGDTISGEVLSAGGEWLDAPLQPKFKTLIDYRYDFVPEMIAISEDI